MKIVIRMKIFPITHNNTVAIHLFHYLAQFLQFREKKQKNMKLKNNFKYTKSPIN